MYYWHNDSLFSAFLQDLDYVMSRRLVRVNHLEHSLPVYWLGCLNLPKRTDYFKLLSYMCDIYKAFIGLYSD